MWDGWWKLVCCWVRPPICVRNGQHVRLFSTSKYNAIHLSSKERPEPPLFHQTHTRGEIIISRFFSLSLSSLVCLWWWSPFFSSSSLCVFLSRLMWRILSARLHSVIASASAHTPYKLIACYPLAVRHHTATGPFSIFLHPQEGRKKTDLLARPCRCVSLLMLPRKAFFCSILNHQPLVGNVS